MVSPTFPDRTLAQVAYDVARLCGLIENQGTSTAGTTTSLTDANNERTPVAQATDITGKYLYGYGGDAVGQSREITTYSTIGVMGWQQAGTSPAANTTWIRLPINPQAILDAIATATRLNMREQAQPYLSESLVTNDLLGHYGDMEQWANGAASAPDGWTLGGAGATVAREATTVGRGVYSAALTPGAGAVGTLTRTFTFEQIRDITGGGLVLEGLVANTTAGNGVVRVTTTNSAGTAANTDRTSTYASNRFEELRDISTATVTVPANMVTLSIQLRAAAGASAVYFDDIMLLAPDLRDYELPANVIGLEDVIEIEDGFRSRRYGLKARYRDMWTLQRDDPAVTARRKLHFKGPLPSGRHMRIRAYIAPTVQATASSNVDPNPEWLVIAAAQHLLEGMKMDEERARRLARLDGMMAELKREKPWAARTWWGRRVLWLEAR